MLVMVRERTAEIGVRRAVGATRADIRNQFLVEAVALTSVGGAIGIALGLLGAFAVRFIISFPAAVPLWAIAGGLIASALIGLLAGLWPALRAARLDPSDAMRSSPQRNGRLTAKGKVAASIHERHQTNKTRAALACMRCRVPNCRPESKQ